MLSLQGGVQEHISMVRECGFKAIEIKKTSDLNALNALILPGGESTAMSLLSRERGLLRAIKKIVRSGMPVFGTCAGAILLARRVGKNTGLIGTMNIVVERNAYGRQLESFEAGLKVKGFRKEFPGVFIRAPIIESVGESVQVLSSFNGRPVLVRQRNMLAATFHPELTEDKRVHEFFFREFSQVL